MPLLVVCGQPLSGKTTVCDKLIEKLEKANKRVICISISSLALSPQEAYQDSARQKITRSGLRSAVERGLSDHEGVVILDALNNIKGFRYEIWCLARSIAAKYCLLHIETSFNTCYSRNTDQARYLPELFDDLWSSFERPDSKNRWETPLFKLQESSEEGILDSVIETICGKTENRGSLTPTTATSNPSLSETNLQYNIDKSVQIIIDQIITLQKETGGEAVGIVSFGSDLPSLKLDRFITVIELRRLKRSFLKVATQGINAKLTDPNSASCLFIEYLEQNL